MTEPAQPEAAAIASAIEKAARTLPSRIPLATYRLQFNPAFVFSDALGTVPYLDALGITDVYSSPCQRARPGSMHGYDIVDPREINPELGGAAGYAEFVASLRERAMGLILDIVPNHMGIDKSNPWWMDVLENGPSSPFAHFFDIDWNPLKEELRNKVILPVLGSHYGRALESGEVRLEFAGGTFWVSYYEHRFPIDPATYSLILGPRDGALAGELGEDSEEYREFLSILTAIRNLPSRTELSAERIAERLREKEIVKRRIGDLASASPAFLGHLGRAIDEFNATGHARRDFDALDGLLDAQAYRLAFWRVATEEINYRRFFDINDLAAIRTEDPDVFAQTHELVFRLVREGAVTGLRIDHPDGLHNPREYFRNLQREGFVSLCMAHYAWEGDDDAAGTFRRHHEERATQDTALGLPLYVIGEKILTGAEKLPESWPVHGTTGYGFMNAAGGLFVDAANARAFDAIYGRFTKSQAAYAELQHEAKRGIMRAGMASEINVLAHALNIISESNRMWRDFTLNSLTDALVEVIAFFPVYRTYIDGLPVDERDRRYIDIAVSRARRRRFDLGDSIFEFIRDTLLLRHCDWADAVACGRIVSFAQRFQQLTGPVMAKGTEDTIFYVYNRLVSLNEVGGTPERFGVSAEAFHGQNIERAKRFPHALLATATHDSKRGEDVRTRISALSEVPSRWKAALSRWARMNRRHKTMVDGSPAPDRNDEYLYYQTLLGSWPHGSMRGGPLPDYVGRVRDYMVKAAREAKRHSGWINQNAEYESALAAFVEQSLASPAFVDDFLGLARIVSNVGIFSSLSQTLLKIASPGVPDFYQGTELWSLHLVDPDNRRPVDYPHRESLLREMRRSEAERGRGPLAEELVRTREDGRIKMYLIYKALDARRRNRALFLDGEYRVLGTSGERADHVLALERRTVSGDSAIAVVPRLVAGLLGEEKIEAGEPLGALWGDTRIELPDDAASSWSPAFSDVFTGTVIRTARDARGARHLPVSRVLGSFPASLLFPSDGADG